GEPVRRIADRHRGAPVPAAVVCARGRHCRTRRGCGERDIGSGEPARRAGRTAVAGKERTAGPQRRGRAGRQGHHQRPPETRRRAVMSWLPTAIRTLLFLLLLAFLAWPEWFEPLLLPLTQAGAPAIYTRES